ncbi:MAG: CIA30 family protein [Saprospiraceae bacterium]|nr:CIA30 family protein [Saprospiraceae bacterium]
MNNFVMILAHFIYSFTIDSDINSWRIINDGVMGGLSQSSINVNADGNGVFQGSVSLANNGGFASVRYRDGLQKIGEATSVKIRLKGDGKKYQFRIKETLGQAHSYVYIFDTSGAWQEIKIPLLDMYPAFRGRKLNYPPFDSEHIEEMAFLISNKKEEKFRLEIAEIRFEK